MRSLAKTNQLSILAAIVLGMMVLGACGGGGGSSLAPPARLQPPGSPQSIQTSIPLSDLGSAIALPSLAGYNESITLTPNTAPAGTALNVAISTTMPNVPAMPADFKETQGFLYFSISSSKTVTLNGFPGFTLTVPPGLTLDGGELHLGFYDPATGWQKIGDVTLVGRTMTFTPTKTALTLKAGVKYVVAPFACVGPTPTPTPTAVCTTAPSTTAPLATGTQLPIPPAGGFTGSWVAAANNAPEGTTVTVTTYLSAPSAAPSPQAAIRKATERIDSHPLLVKAPLIFIKTVYSTPTPTPENKSDATSGTTITFAKFPAVSIGLPTNFNSSGVTFKLETFDLTTGALLDEEIGTLSDSNSVVSFTGTNTQFVVNTSHAYLWELVANSVTLYVANAGNNTITEYDQDGNEITTSGTFQNTNGPVAIAFDSSNGHLYVVNLSTPSITEYDQNGNQINTAGTFPNLDEPVGIAFDSSNSHLYVTNLGPEQTGPYTITEYDQNGNQITTAGTFPNLDGPFGVAFDSSNSHLYVMNADSSTITEYDQDGNQITPSGSFPNLDEPFGMAFDSSNGHLYVTNFGNAKITEYDQNGNQIITSGAFPNLNFPFGIALDSSNNHLYVTNTNNNTITEYDQNGNQITPSGTFPNLEVPEGLTIVP